MVKFLVTKGQKLVRADDKVISAGTSDLIAQFELSEEFEGAITAYWQRDLNSQPFAVVLDASKSCRIPWEALSVENDEAWYKEVDHVVYVSLADSGRTTTSRCEVKIAPTSWSGSPQNGSTPTPTQMEQITRIANEIVMVEDPATQYTKLRITPTNDDTAVITPEDLDFLFDFDGIGTTWQSGYFNPNTGAKASSTNYMRTNNATEFRPFSRVVMDPAVADTDAFRIFFYTTSTIKGDNFIRRTDDLRSYIFDGSEPVGDDGKIHAAIQYHHTGISGDTSYVEQYLTVKRVIGIKSDAEELIKSKADQTYVDALAQGLEDQLTDKAGKSDLVEHKSVRTRQLLDFENAVQFNATLSGAAGMVSSSHGKVVLVHLPKTTENRITVHRGIVGKRFGIGLCASEDPTIGTPMIRYIGGDTAEELYLAMDASAKSLLIYYYLDTQDVGISPDDLLASIMVNYGTYSGYEPYVETIDVPKFITKKENPYVPEFSDELMPTTLTWTGTGWTSPSNGVFVHTVGEYLPLEITLTESTANNSYKLEFDIESPTDTKSPDASNAVYPSIGGSKPFSLYFGETGNVHYVCLIKSVENGKLVFQPCSPSIPSVRGRSFDGTIKNISLKKVLSIRESVNQFLDEHGSANIDLIQTDSELMNVFFGLNSGENLYTGYGNVGMGYQALKNVTSGFWNVGIGEEALRDCTVGSRNIALGYHALMECSGGDRNIAIGSYALCRNYGFRNIAIGADTLWYNTKGYQNVSIGMATLHSNTEGNENVGVGIHAIHDNQTGSFNTAIGGEAMYHATGSGNTCVGYGTDVSAGKDESIAIGHNAKVTKSRQMVLGTDVIEEVIIAGKKIMFNSDGTVTWTAV